MILTLFFIKQKLSSHFIDKTKAQNYMKLWMTLLNMSAEIPTISIKTAEDKFTITDTANNLK